MALVTVYKSGLLVTLGLGMGWMDGCYGNDGGDVRGWPCGDLKGGFILLKNYFLENHF